MTEDCQQVSSLVLPFFHHSLPTARPEPNTVQGSQAPFQLFFLYLLSFSEILAHVSRSVTVRLKTNDLSEESTGSAQK